MAITWKSYGKWVLPEVASCPVDQIADAVLQAAREFCERTRSYKVLTSGQTVSSTGVAITGAHDVPITVPVGAEIFVPLFATVTMSSNKYLLTPKSPQDLDLLTENWRTSQDTIGTPVYMTMRDMTNLAVAPWPAANGTISYEVAFVPSMSSIEGPDFLFNKHGLVIAQGAKGILLMQGTQKWGNPTLGAAYWEKFLKDCTSATVRYERGQVDAPITTRTEYQ